MIGKRLSPILEEIENTIWEFEANVSTQPNYTPDGFRAATKIFMSALMDKMWDMQKGGILSIDARGDMAFKAGEELHKLIKTYTDIDTYKFYKHKTQKKPL